ncbi:hypothetical protein CBR_g27773 [Chara braunii]|uniref:Amino acid permease/ SLC12A domain-containing protein n=1 Tax=Chara braunii TaxID=69332 RepID=A0A388L8C4_CHABU|nr:hypothetical protein CBR_g27773 [Chara braunii]|eukprot:GBG78547.1 hypothetical protein CBR_g27773 [Chara braunii]
MCFFFFRLTVRVRADDSATKPSLTIEDQGMLSPTNSTIFDRQVRDAGLELFEMDPLVDVLVLKKMANQRDAPESPREGDDVGLTSVRIKKGAKLGTLMGVFIPCLQNILGIIFYIRMSWIIGMAGVGQSLGLIALCCSCTFLTGLSLSAIATNGAMKGGGPYFLIGRALGPEVGVSIGLCFFFGNAVAASMYILGAVETILNAIPDMALFGATTTQVDTNLTMPDAVHNITSHVKSPNLHDLQVYGIIITILLCLIVFGGVKILASVGPLFLIPVLLSVVLIFIGMFVSPRDGQPDDVTGIRWSTFVENWDPAYQRTNSNGIPARDGIMNWAFRDLVGLFFPAVTGIMAGSNRSASLKDTQRSIPVGTLGAITSTTFMYFFATFMFGAVATRHRLLTDR